MRKILKADISQKTMQTASRTKLCRGPSPKSPFWNVTKTHDDRRHHCCVIRHCPKMAKRRCPSAKRLVQRHRICMPSRNCLCRVLRCAWQACPRVGQKAEIRALSAFARCARHRFSSERQKLVFAYFRRTRSRADTEPALGRRGF